MHFYVDESGHTGLNLFDPHQPLLYYGCLSCQQDLDQDAVTWMESLREKVKAPRIHANELGQRGLAIIARDLLDMHRQYRLHFGLYRVAKPDHAIICFYDQVFDAGMNPAVTWTSYWTPLRYILLFKVASLFTMELAKQAWAARIETSPSIANKALISLCASLMPRVAALPDQRSRELIRDALQWAIDNPTEISYNVDSRKSALQIAPNIVGFQMVMQGIARGLKAVGMPASRIVVDRQSQFNKAQRTLAEFYAAAGKTNGILQSAPDMPEIDYEGMPTTPIEISGGDMSVGLELTDTFLWLLKRHLEGEEPAEVLRPLIQQLGVVTETNEISLKALGARWSRWLASLPEIEAMPDSQVVAGKKLQVLEESRRLKALGREVPTAMAELAAAARDHIEEK